MDLLAAMRIFVRVVERGSMSGAARDLGIGQPAVSERIERLEQYLGVQLLRRNSRALACTDEGLLFHTRCQHVLDAAEEACAAVAKGADGIFGTVRIAAPQCFGGVVLPRALLRIRELHPRLCIELVLNDLVVDPVTEGVDMSLRLGATGEGNFIAHPLGHVRRMLVCAPDYLARHGDIASPRDLANHPFIHVKGQFNNEHLPLVGARQSEVLVPIRPCIVVSHWRPMYEMVLASAGVGVVEEPACAEALAVGRLVRLLPTHTVPSYELNALVPAARPVPLKTQAVVAILKAHLPGASALGTGPLTGPGQPV